MQKKKKKNAITLKKYFSLGLRKVSHAHPHALMNTKEKIKATVHIEHQLVTGKAGIKEHC